MNEGDCKRYPTNFQGLLQFCVDHSTKEIKEDTTGVERHFEKSSDEKQAWLKKALESMTTNYTQILLKSMKIVMDNKDKEEEEAQDMVEVALEDLIFNCENLDMANEFHKIGGLDFINLLLAHKKVAIRAQGAGLVGALCQNNSDGQIKLCNFLPLLMEKLKTDEPDFQSRCLFAISCMIRESSENLKTFIKLEGLKYLASVINHKAPDIRLKSIFTLSNLSSSQNDIKEQIVEANVLEEFSKLFLEFQTDPPDEDWGGNQIMEMTLETLKELSSNKKALESCRKLKIKESLEKLKPNYKEIVSIKNTMEEIIKKL